MQPRLIVQLVALYLAATIKLAAVGQTSESIEVEFSQCDTKRETRAGSYEAPQDCGVATTSRQYDESRNRHPQYRLLNGEPVEGGKWQFFATLVGQSESRVCGATIIGNEYVVTSKTCATAASKPANESSLRILLGHPDRTQESFNGKVVWVYRSCSSLGYSIRPSINGAYRSKLDFLIIKLDERLDFGDTIQPACLADSADILTDKSSECIVIGHSGTFGQDLELRSAPIKYFKCWMEDESQFCFKSASNEKRVITCANDSGGPVLCKREDRWHLVGVVSTTPTNCSRELWDLGVFNVATKLDFVIATNTFGACMDSLIE